MANISDLSDATLQQLAAGKTPDPSTMSDKELEYMAQNPPASSGPSKLESFGRGALRNFPLAQQATAAVESGDYSQNLQDLISKAQAAKAANPISYGAGATAGAVAPAFIPGIGEAGIAGNAALSAAGSIGDTDLIKHPGEALKQAAIGGGTGAAISGILGKVLPDEQSLTQYANKKSVQTLGLNPGDLGLPDAEIQALGAKAEAVGATRGSPQARLANVNTALEPVKAEFDATAAATPITDVSRMHDLINQHMQDSADMLGMEGNPEIKMYQLAQDRIREGMSFDELQKLKGMYGQRAFDKMGGVKNEAAANIYHTINKGMEEAANSNSYIGAKGEYGALKDMKDALTKQLGVEQANGAPMKGIGLVGKMGSAVTGGSVPATLGMAGMLGATHPLWGAGMAATLAMNPQAMNAGARALAPKMAAGITGGTQILQRLLTNPQSFGRFSAPLLKAAQTGGQNGVNATHFLLASQYPEYNQMAMGTDGSQQ